MSPESFKEQIEPEIDRHFRYLKTQNYNPEVEDSLILVALFPFQTGLWFLKQLFLRPIPAACYVGLLYGTLLISQNLLESIWGILSVAACLLLLMLITVRKTIIFFEKMETKTIVRLLFHKPLLGRIFYYGFLGLTGILGGVLGGFYFSLLPENWTGWLIEQTFLNSDQWLLIFVCCNFLYLLFLKVKYGALCKYVSLSGHIKSPI